MIPSDKRDSIPEENQDRKNNPVHEQNMGKGYEEKANVSRNYAENMNENERRNLNPDREKRAGSGGGGLDPDRNSGDR